MSYLQDSISTLCYCYFLRKNARSEYLLHLCLCSNTKHPLMLHCLHLREDFCVAQFHESIFLSKLAISTLKQSLLFSCRHFDTTSRCGFNTFRHKVKHVIIKLHDVYIQVIMLK